MGAGHLLISFLLQAMRAFGSPFMGIHHLSEWVTDLEAAMISFSKHICLL